MKQLLVLFAFLLTFVLPATAQVKVSDLTTYSGDASTAWFMAVINNTSRKVMGRDIARNKIDSVTVSNDSVYVWNNLGTKNFSFKLTGADKMILNQYVEKQSASAWFDSVRLTGLRTDTARVKRRLFIGDSLNTNAGSSALYTTGKVRINSSKFKGNAGNFQYPGEDPYLSVGGVSDTTTTYDQTVLATFGRTNKIRGQNFNHGWGANVLYYKNYTGNVYNKGEIQLDTTINEHQLLVNDNNPTGLNLNEFTLRPIAYGFGANFKVNFGGGNWTGGIASNQFTATDLSLGVGGSTASNGQIRGHLSNHYSRFRFASGASSHMENFYHYVAGSPYQWNNNSFGRMIGFYASQQGFTGVSRPYGFYQQGATDLNQFEGKVLIGDTTVANAGTAMLYVKGDIKAANKVIVEGLAMFNDTSYSNVLAATGDPAKSMAAYHGNGLYVRSTGRKYVYAGDGNNWNYNYGPLFSVAEKGRYASEVLRGQVAGISRSIDSTIGGGPWGEGTWWPSGNVFGVSQSYNMKKGSYNLGGDHGNWDKSTMQSMVYHLSREDSVVWNQGSGLNGQFNFVASWNNFGTGGRYAAFNGDYRNNTSISRTTAAGPGSYMERFFHYTLIHYGGMPVKQLYGYHAEPLNKGGSTVLGRSWAFYNEGEADRNYFAGQTLIGDTTIANAGTAKLYVNGDIKANNILASRSYYWDNGTATGPTSNQSIFVGDSAGRAATPGNTYDASNATGIGYRALGRMTTGVNNTAVGANALRYVVTGGFNTALGDRAGASIVSGAENTFIGQAAGDGSATGTWSYNTVIGASALRNVVGDATFNVVMGKNAAIGARSMHNNTYIGYATGYQVTGNNNVFLGFRAGQSAGDSVSNRLLIHNNNVGTNYATQSLIYGEFDNKLLRVNGRIAAGINGAGTGVFNLPAQTPPTSSADATGIEGDLLHGTDGNLYLKTSSGWVRFAGTTF